MVTLCASSAGELRTIDRRAATTIRFIDEFTTFSEIQVPHG
jgi:hypothetical protein